MKQLIIPFVLSVIISSCVIFRTNRFAQADFDFKNIETFTAAGINVLHKAKLTDLGWKEGTKLTSAIGQANVPVTMKMNVDVTNNAKGIASLVKLDWILLIKNKEVLNGTTNERIKIDGNGGKAVLPLTFNFELFKIFKDHGITGAVSAMWDMAQNPEDPDVISVKLKPYFNIAGLDAPMPGYITVKY